MSFILSKGYFYNKSGFIYYFELSTRRTNIHKNFRWQWCYNRKFISASVGGVSVENKVKRGLCKDAVSVQQYYAIDWNESIHCGEAPF